MFALVLAVCVLLVVVPIFAIGTGSFMTRFGFFHLAQPWTLDNWARTLEESVFGRSVRNTLLLAFTAAIVSPLVCSVIAYVVERARHVWGRGLLDLLLLLWVPSVIPGALAGFEAASRLRRRAGRIS